jgi:hypothetical protein
MLEVTGTKDDYLLMNVNRWRDQLQLPPLTAEQLPKETEQLSAGDLPFVWVALQGTAKGGGSMAPFAGKAPPRAPVGPPAGATGDSDVQFELPTGWEKIPPPSSIQKLAFRVRGDEEEGEKLDITLTFLGGDAGGLMNNVNRWRGQIKLPPLAEDELEKSLQEIAAVNAPGKWTENIGPEDAMPRQAILGAILSHGGGTWFVKAQGAAKLAEQERERLQEFIRSLRLP